MVQAENATPYRILVVDNHKILRQGLRFLLEKTLEFDVVGDADSSSALAAAIQLKPRIILMNLLLPHIEDGMGLVAELRQRVPDARLVVLTSTVTDPRMMFDLIRLGVSGCVPPETSDTGSLEAAIRKVGQGQTYFTESVLISLVDGISRGESFGKANAREEAGGLSPREEEVLELVAKGHTNRQIADTLVISESTVRTHLHNILDKLKLENRVQVAAYALRLRGNNQTLRQVPARRELA
jgi:DNA-binding NarL/FixJ family response regulator